MSTARQLVSRVSALALCALAASCASQPDDGRYLAFVRDVMAQSASQQAPAANARSERAMLAVEVWRGAAGASTATAAGSGQDNGQ